MQHPAGIENDIPSMATPVRPVHPRLAHANMISNVPPIRKRLQAYIVLEMPPFPLRDS